MKISILLLFISFAVQAIGQRFTTKEEVTMNFVIGSDTVTKELFTHYEDVAGSFDDDPVGRKTTFQEGCFTSLEQIRELDSIFIEGYRILNFRTSLEARGMDAECGTGHASFCDACYFNFNYPTDKKIIFLFDIQIQDIASGKVFQYPGFRIYAPKRTEEKMSALSRELNNWLSEKESSYGGQLDVVLKERTNNCFFLDVSSKSKTGRLTSYGNLRDLTIEVTDMKTGKTVHFSNESANDLKGLTDKLNTLLELVLEE